MTVSIPVASFALGATEVDIRATRCTVRYAIVHNPGAATAYFKIWRDIAANVNPATDAPDISVGVAAGQTTTVWLGDSDCANGACMAATAEAGAGASAPSSPFVVTAFWS